MIADLASLARPSIPWGLKGVRVWDGTGTVHEAIAFSADGRVASLGRDAVATTLERGGTLVDGDGVFVCPGFVDPHLHVRASASALLGTDVSHARSRGEVVATVSRTAPSSEGWISLVGLSAERPQRAELDRAGRGMPVRIRDRTGHGWVLSSAALERVGLDPLGTSDAAPAGVIIERGSDGTPTGFVADHIGWTGNQIGRLNSDERIDGAVRAWSTALARSGIVAICDATATNGDAEVEALDRWRREGTLRQEVTCFTAPIATVQPQLVTRVAGVKLASAHDPALLDALAVDDSVVAVHCVTAEETGVALEAARKSGAGGRLRIEHASFVPPDWIATARETGAQIVTHPSFITAHGDRYLDDGTLTPHDWLYRLRSWVDAGVPLAFASDAPFGPYEPVAALAAAATRRTEAGEMIGADEALTGDAALAAVTSVAADCSGLGHLGYGRLQTRGPGAAVILSGDPRDESRLAGIEIVATVIEGAVVD